MRRPSTAMRAWLSIATAAQKVEVATAAGTSIKYLEHIAAGRRQISADLAQRLVHASKELHVRALYLDQKELCAACAACPIAR